MFLLPDHLKTPDEKIIFLVGYINGLQIQVNKLSLKLTLETAKIKCIFNPVFWDDSCTDKKE
jgi:hypothetical protein